MTSAKTELELPTPADFSSSFVTGPLASWAVMSNEMQTMSVVAYKFHNEMLELVGHKTTGSVPTAEVRAAAYSILISVWNTFEERPNGQDFKNAVLERLARNP